MGSRSLVLLNARAALWPGLTAAVAGFASAAAAALLVFFQAYDASATDLVVHVIAVGWRSSPIGPWGRMLRGASP
jgi:hypothetical protein